MSILSFEDLKFYRQLASSKIKQKADKKAQESSGWGGWLSGMVSTPTSPAKNADPAQELKQLYDAFDVVATDFTASATNEDVNNNNISLY